MYLGYQGDKIKFYTEVPLDATLCALDKIEETEDEYILSPDGTEYVLKDAESESAWTEKRQEDFYKNFLATSLGNYRLQPKGYANAQQSIDTINNVVMLMGGLNETIAQMVIFYDTPDFSKEEECTEEWLIQHQHHPSTMTTAKWGQFYVEFTTKYAAAQYRQETT